jgi:hypothetical protein
MRKKTILLLLLPVIWVVQLVNMLKHKTINIIQVYKIKIIFYKLLFFFKSFDKEII